MYLCPAPRAPLLCCLPVFCSVMPANKKSVQHATPKSHTHRHTRARTRARGRDTFRTCLVLPQCMFALMGFSISLFSTYNSQHTIPTLDETYAWTESSCFASAFGAISRTQQDCRKRQPSFCVCLHFFDCYGRHLWLSFGILDVSDNNSSFQGFFETHLNDAACPP